MAARRGGVRGGGAAHARRGGVRYGGSGHYPAHPIYRPGWHGHAHRPIYRSYYRRWRDFWFHSYSCRPWGAGCGVAYWDPYYYNAYGDTWVGGSPAFGFGSVYYGPTYVSYFSTPAGEYVEGDYVEGEYAVDEGYTGGSPGYVIVEEEPVAAGPAPVVEAPVEEALLPEDVPGRADFEAGVTEFLEGRYREALAHFRTAAEADPENGEAWMAVAHAGFASGRWQTSARALAQAADLGAFPRGYRYDPTAMYPDEGRFEKLLARLQAWRKTHLEDADANLVAAYFHVAMGETDEAHQAILRVLSFRPEDQTAPVLTMAMLPPLPPEALPGGDFPVQADGAELAGPATTAPAR